MSSATPEAGFSVVLVGATGAVGKDLVSGLEKAPFPIRELRLVASRRSAEAELSFRGAPLEVQPLGARLGPEALLREADLVILAVPAEVARQLAPVAVQLGAPVIDVGGALFERGPVFLPGLGLELAHFDRTRVVSTPWAPVAALATLLAPLRELRLEGARGLALLSAGLFGRAGLDELSAQVVALFGGGSPPRKVFPAGLAFDLVEPPASTDPRGGWSESEQRLARETGALLGVEPNQLAVGVMLAPLFAGLALSLHLRFSGDPSAEDLRAALERAEGVRYGDPLPSPRRLPGRSGLYVGRLRADPAGDGFHLWATADNLRFGATAPAIGAATALWREGRLGRA